MTWRLHSGYLPALDNPDNTREDRIKQRAYEIWEREGQPEGDHDRHWHQAAREIAEEDAADRARTDQREAATPARTPKRVARGKRAAGAVPAATQPVRDVKDAPSPNPDETPKRTEVQDSAIEQETSYEEGARAAKPNPAHRAPNLLHTGDPADEPTPYGLTESTAPREGLMTGTTVKGRRARR